jgi:hypothetical protein
MSAGTVTTVSVDFSAFVSPEEIRCRPDPGAKMMAIGDGSERALCYKAEQWSSGAEGNHNARWRRRMKRRKSAWY